jgi:hypothetical protein
LSFFDEADEPSVTPRTAPRTRRPSGGGGRRPPTDQQSIMTRRAIAAGVILVFLIVVILLVRSCQNSAHISGLKDYANSVFSIEQQSVNNGRQFFTTLGKGAGNGGAQALTTSINDSRVTAQNQLNKAQGLSVPDEMKAAQQKFLFALQLRLDGIANIGTQIQPALGTTANKDAINKIAAEMARFYASDVAYKDYTVPEMIGALKGAGIAVGGTNGVPIAGGQFLTDLSWLTPTLVSQKLGAQSATSTAECTPTPGTHGHSLDSVSVGGTTLDSSATNSVPASPPPTFTFHFTNSGTNTESNVVLKVTISGTSLTAQTTVPQTTAGQSATGSVALKSSPPTGTYSVKATVEPVCGEKNTANNTQTYQVTFQ